jgi:hypothetical protein
MFIHPLGLIFCSIITVNSRWLQNFSLNNDRGNIKKAHGRLNPQRAPSGGQGPKVQLLVHLAVTGLGRVTKACECPKDAAGLFY